MSNQFGFGFDLGPTRFLRPEERENATPKFGQVFWQNFEDTKRVTADFATSTNMADAYDEINDSIAKATGTQLVNPMNANAPVGGVRQGDGFSFGKALEALDPHAEWRRQINELRAEHADALPWDEVLEAPLKLARERTRATREATNEMAATAGLIADGREIPYLRNVPVVRSIAALGYNAVQNPALAAAQLAGGFAGSFTSAPDALANLLGFGAGRATDSLLKAMLKNSASNAAIQMPLSALKQKDYREAGLPWGFDVWLAEVEGAAATGALLDVGVRAPGRAYLRRFGRDVAPGEFASRNTERGTFWTDAPDKVENYLQPPAVKREDVSRETVEKAQAGDIEALKEIATKTGAIEDPAVKGMLDHVETGGSIDDAVRAYFKQNGIDAGEGIRTLVAAMRAGDGGYVRAPEPVPEARTLLLRDEAAALIVAHEAEIGRMLAGVDPQIARQVQMGLEAGLPHVVTAVREAIARVGADGAEKAQASLLTALEKAAADAGGREQLADQVAIHTSTNPIEIAAAMRRSPDMVDASVPLGTDVMRMARAMAALDGDAFVMVRGGEAPVGVASAVADLVPPGLHSRVLHDLKRAGAATAREAEALIPELLPPPKVDAPEFPGSRIDDPMGPEAKANTERLAAEHAEAVAAAEAPIKMREKLEAKVEELKGEIAKLEADRERESAGRAESGETVARGQEGEGKLYAIADEGRVTEAAGQQFSTDDQLPWGGTRHIVDSNHLTAADAIERVARNEISLPTAAELEAAANAVRGGELRILAEAFGGGDEGLSKAKRWQRLWREADENISRERAEKLDAEREALSAEAKSGFDDIELADEPTLRDLAGVFRDMEQHPGEIPDILPRHLAQLPLSDKDPAAWTLSEAKAVAIMRKAGWEIQANGLDQKQISRELLARYAGYFSDPKDAQFMIDALRASIVPADKAQQIAPRAGFDNAEFNPAKADSPQLLAAITDPEAAKLAKLRRDLIDTELQLLAMRAERVADDPAALYRLVMRSAAVQRQRDLDNALMAALRFAGRVLPEGTNVEIKPDAAMVHVGKDGTRYQLDATSDPKTGDVALALHALDPAGRIGHEGVHTLVTRGHISPDEVALLAKAAREAGVFANEAKYREAYKDRANFEALIEEEAAAHLIEAVVNGKVKVDMPATLIERIKALIERIRSYLNGAGFHTPEDVIHAIVSGEAARRMARDAWMRHNDFSAVAVKEPLAALQLFALSDRDTGQSMRRDLDALGYYSQALEAAKGLKQAKGTPEQMWRQIVDAPGVRDNEIIATNLHQRMLGEDGARAFERMVSLRAQVDESRQEIAKGFPKLVRGEGEDNKAWSSRQAARKAEIEQQIGQPVQDLAQVEAEVAAAARAQTKSVTRDEIVKHLEENRVGLREVQRGDVPDYPGNPLAGETKWSAHSLDPSNPSYRETVLHLPGMGKISFEDWLSYKRSFGEDIPDNASGRAQYDAYLKQHGWRDMERDFQSGHFDEPNIVGHMMTSMVKHEGRPVYLIDQIQSDWGQKLRDGGVRDEAKIAGLRDSLDKTNAEISALAEQFDALPLSAFQEISGLASAVGRTPPKDTTVNELSATLYYITNPVDGRNVEPYVVEQVDALRKKHRSALDWHRAQFRPPHELASRKSRLEAELRTAEAATPGHPLVNTTDQWTITTLRRALRQAVEAGAEFIAIPHGDTVLRYNPGDTDGMRGFYGSRTSEGIVPKNLRKLLEKIDKDSARPVKTDALDTPAGTRGSGFTLFPLTDKVRAEVMENGQQLFAFAGERARTADLDALAKAKQMDADGSPREDIWDQTGWFRGVDGKWRFEIDDSGAHALHAASPTTVGEALSHPDLYAAYPKTDAVKFQPQYDGGGMYDHGSIIRGPRMTAGPWDTSTMLHEGQHRIQALEGFTSGSSPEAEALRTRYGDGIGAKVRLLRDLIKSRGDISIEGIEAKNAFNAYRRNAGEVEALAVEKRMDLTPDQRRARPPWLDYDVPEDQQIVRFADGKSVEKAERQQVVDAMSDAGDKMFAINDNEPRTPLRDDMEAIDRMQRFRELVEACR